MPLRAWRGLGGCQHRAPLLHWLYRIATMACLKLIEVRARTPVPVGEVGDDGAVSHLQPYADRRLAADPAALLEHGRASRWRSSRHCSGYRRPSGRR